MALLVGALLAFAVGLCATVSGLDRDRAFYPTVSQVGGQRSVSRTMRRQQGTRRGCSRAGVFVLQPDHRTHVTVLISVDGGPE
jgi:hypothetical protein